MRILAAVGLSLPVMLTLAGCGFRIYRLESGGVGTTRAARLSARETPRARPVEFRRLSTRPVRPVDTLRPAAFQYMSRDEQQGPVSAQIAERIAASRAEWRDRSMDIKNGAPPGSAEPGSRQSVETEFADKRISQAMLAAERRYAAEILNCRLRVSVLNARLASQDPFPEVLLRRKLEAAQARLAALEEACRAEGEGRAEAASSIRLRSDTAGGDVEPTQGD